MRHYDPGGAKVDSTADAQNMTRQTFTSWT
jgi:hypothetical protein